MKIILASNNAHKAREIEHMLPTGMKIETLREVGYNKPIIEDADTFEGNALIKARAIFSEYGRPCMADDSGLEVNCLNGAPGVFSARYSGEGATDEENNKKLLEAIRGKEDLSARFRTVIAYIDKSGAEHLFEGCVEGCLTTSPRGSEGFGYDPLFCPLEFPNLTFAELSLEDKNKISHRSRALHALTAWLSSK
ncbi:MAG: RdgB/HAM1 family non-canonical purine NTP pyrophosphatase [Bacteroidia bacterium]|nr:RdgB/HAM1 family non-canonical purine NTP pyrophosphatase [Bacteroidia bacterium]